MSKKNTTGPAEIETLQAMHNALAEALLNKVRSGEATAADLAVARQFLKDNSIDAIPDEANGLGKLANSVPFLGADEGDEQPAGE